MDFYLIISAVSRGLDFFIASEEPPLFRNIEDPFLIVSHIIYDKAMKC